MRLYGTFYQMAYFTFHNIQDALSILPFFIYRPSSYTVGTQCYCKYLNILHCTVYPIGKVFYKLIIKDFDSIIIPKEIKVYIYNPFLVSHSLFK